MSECSLTTFDRRLSLGLSRGRSCGLGARRWHLPALIDSLLLERLRQLLGDAETTLDGVVGSTLSEVVCDLFEVDLR